MSHWIFEALLLKTAMTLPLIFDECIDETVSEMNDRHMKEAKRINCMIAIFVTLTGLLSFANIVLLIPQESVIFTLFVTSFQSLTLISVVFYLRYKINMFQPQLAKMRLIMTHLVNFILLSVIWIA